MYLLSINFVLIILMHFLLLLLLENDLISSPVNVSWVQGDICAGKDNNKMQNKTKIRISFFFCVVVTASALVAGFTPNNDFTTHTHTPLRFSSHKSDEVFITMFYCFWFVFCSGFYVLMLIMKYQPILFDANASEEDFRLQSLSSVASELDHVFSSAAVCRFVLCF